MPLEQLRLAKQNWLIPDSELARPWAITPTPHLGMTVDGFVSLSNALPLNFTYDPNDRAVSGDYDAIGVLEHEISEAMGRVADYPGGEGLYSAARLLRYTSNETLATDGKRAWPISRSTAAIPMKPRSTADSNGGDAGDWSTAVLDDSYDAFTSIGVANTVSATDLTVMNVLGYTLADTSVCFVAGNADRHAVR